MLNKNRAENPFEGKIRVRAVGILMENDKTLLLRHENLGSAGHLWSPPGGGVEFGKTVAETLKREFLEETNLEVEVGEYLFTNEFIGNPYHAIELFFEVKRISGTLRLGSDPELAPNAQILTEAKFFSMEEISLLQKGTIHNIFNTTGTADKITDLRGLFTFKH
ncbi:MAG: NUDIX hydrolase [Ekhidna sp.]